MLNLIVIEFCFDLIFFLNLSFLVAGYGAFLGSPIAYPGDLIAEYTGEIISEEEADRRGRLYDKRACSYLFNLDMQHCIDARQFGNKLRLEIFKKKNIFTKSIDHLFFFLLALLIILQKQIVFQKSN